VLPFILLSLPFFPSYLGTWHPS
jgi:N-alpha-acetyltransferase 30